MRIAVAIAVLVAVVLAFAVARPAGAQELTQQEVEIDVREGMTLIDPGRPVTDGRAAYVEDGAGPEDAAASSTPADAQGRIRLPYRGEGRTVLVWAPGRAPVALRVNVPIPFTVQMSPALSCDVQVTTPAGAAIGAAEVVAESLLPVVHASSGAPDVHRMRLVAKTPGDGRVRFEGLADLPLAVTAHADGFVDRREFPVDPRRGATLVLGRGSRVAGKILLTPGDLPAKGAKVLLGARAATAGDDGAFAFETVPPGTYELTFEGAGLVAPPPKTIVLDDGRDRTGLDVRAWRTSTLPGRVVVPAGRNVAGLRLVVTYPPSAAMGVREAFVLVDPDGKFTVRDLPPCDGVAVTAMAPGYVAARVDGVSLPAGDAALEMEVRLVPGAAITGTLTDLESVPVVGALIVASDARTAGRELARTLTIEGGAFTVEGVPAGEAWLRLVGRPAGTETAFGPFEVKADATLDVGALSAFAGYTLRGRVTGAQAGTTIVVAREGADVAEAALVGEDFAFAGLPAGPVALRVEKDGAVVGTASASLPAAWPVTIAFAPESVVRGVVLDADGRPAVTATLRAERLDEAGRASIELRDPAGRFELRLARGRWRIEAGDGVGAGGVVEVVLPDDADRDIVVRIERGGTVHGLLVAAENAAPLEGATVRALVVGDARSHATARVDAFGHFTLTGVPPGIVRLRVETLDRGVHELGPRSLRESEEIDVGTVELARGTTVRGEVFGVGGGALRLATVEFECDAGTVRTVRTDEFGRFVVEGLPAGGAILRIRGEDGSILRARRIDVPFTWDEWRLRIDVEDGTRVSGRVQTAGRVEAFARVVLRMWDPVATETSAVADAQGRFVLRPVAPGRGEVEVLVAGATTGWRRPLAVERGVEQWGDLDLPEAAVWGHVETFDGAVAISGATVELWSPRRGRLVAAARSDGDGRFDLKRVPPGEYDVIATCDGYGPAWLRGIVVRRGMDTSDVRVVLAPEGRIVVRAVDERGLPVSTAWAVAWADDGGGGGPDWSRVGPVATAYADVDGRIVLRGLARGAWRIAVGGPGRAQLGLGRMVLDEGQRDLGDVWLTRGSILRVVALGGDYRAGRLPGVEIEVRDVWGGDPRPLRRSDDPLLGPDPAYVTGADGAIELSGLAPGSYRVRPAGRPDAEIRVRVRRDAVVDAYLPVPPEPPEPVEDGP